MLNEPFDVSYFLFGVSYFFFWAVSILFIKIAINSLFS